MGQNPTHSSFRKKKSRPLHTAMSVTLNPMRHYQFVDYTDVLLSTIMPTDEAVMMHQQDEEAPPTRIENEAAAMEAEIILSSQSPIHYSDFFDYSDTQSPMNAIAGMTGVSFGSFPAGDDVTDDAQAHLLTRPTLIEDAKTILNVRIHKSRTMTPGKTRLIELIIEGRQCVKKQIPLLPELATLLIEAYEAYLAEMRDNANQVALRRVLTSASKTPDTRKRVATPTPITPITSSNNAATRKRKRARMNRRVKYEEEDDEDDYMPSTSDDEDTVHHDGPMRTPKRYCPLPTTPLHIAIDEEADNDDEARLEESPMSEAPFDNDLEVDEIEDMADFLMSSQQVEGGATMVPSQHMDEAATMTANDDDAASASSILHSLSTRQQQTSSDTAVTTPINIDAEHEYTGAVDIYDDVRRLMGQADAMDEMCKSVKSQVKAMDKMCKSVRAACARLLHTIEN